MKELLPIGSVVLLEGGNTRVMICGRIHSPAGESRIFDYSACYFPEGIMDAEELFLFDHEDINIVCFTGLQDEEEIEFRAGINEYLENLSSQSDETQPRPAQAEPPVIYEVNIPADGPVAQSYEIKQVPLNNGSWVCPTCGIVNTGKFCKEDGTPKPTGNSPPTAPNPAVPLSGAGRCPTCGNGVNMGAKFCKNCGSKL